MSDQRRFGWYSGRLPWSPLAQIWQADAPNRTLRNPQIQLMPLETANLAKTFPQNAPDYRAVRAVQVIAVVNLLLTTLAAPPAAPPVGLNAPHFAPQRAQFLPDDTSLGMQLVLRPPPDVTRGPTYQQAKTRPPVEADQPPNLLTSTLATVQSAPVGSSAQAQTPQRRWQGSNDFRQPITLLAAPFAGFAHFAPPIQFEPVADTSRGWLPPPAVVTAPFAQSDTAPFISRQHGVVDTSQGFLPPPAAVSAPFIPSDTAEFISRTWGVTDTSRGFLPPPAVVAPFVPSATAWTLDLRRLSNETSLGFLPPAVIAAPFVPSPTAWSLDLRGLLDDTSLGNTRILPVAAPFVPAPTAWPLRTPWQVVDTTAGTPAIAFVVPPAPPPTPAPHYGPQRPVLLLSETSIGTSDPLRDSDPGPPPPPPPSDGATQGGVPGRVIDDWPSDHLVREHIKRQKRQDEVDRAKEQAKEKAVAKQRAEVETSERLAAEARDSLLLIIARIEVDEVRQQLEKAFRDLESVRQQQALRAVAEEEEAIAMLIMVIAQL